MLVGYVWGFVAWNTCEWKYEEAVLLLEAAGTRPPHKIDRSEPQHAEAIQRLDRRPSF
jgi:hypothetical protein